MIIIAVAVVLLLWFLSTRAPTGGTSTQPVFAHGNEGPVLKTPGGASGQSIREIDFTSLLSGETSRGRALEGVIYVDIDADGTEEAVAAVRGTGEFNPLSWRLYGMKDGGVEVLYERTDLAQGGIKVDGPRIVESEGLYGDGDQPCCPSSLKRTFYVWKGGSLVVSRVETAPPGA